MTTTRWRLYVTMETLWQQQDGGYAYHVINSTSSTVQSQTELVIYFLILRPSQHLLQNLTYILPSSPKILTAIESNISLLGHDNVYCCRNLPTPDAIPHTAVILKFSPACYYFIPPPLRSKCSPHQTSSQTTSAYDLSLIICSFRLIPMTQSVYFIISCSTAAVTVCLSECSISVC